MLPASEHAVDIVLACMLVGAEVFILLLVSTGRERRMVEGWGGKQKGQRVDHQTGTSVTVTE